MTRLERDFFFLLIVFLTGSCASKVSSRKTAEPNRGLPKALVQKAPEVPQFRLTGGGETTGQGESEFGVFAQSKGSPRASFELKLCSQESNRCDPSEENPEIFLGRLPSLRSSLSGDLEASVRSCSPSFPKRCSPWSQAQPINLRPSDKRSLTLAQKKSALMSQLLASCKETHWVIDRALKEQQTTEKLKNMMRDYRKNVPPELCRDISLSPLPDLLRKKVSKKWKDLRSRESKGLSLAEGDMDTADQVYAGALLTMGSLGFVTSAGLFYSGVLDEREFNIARNKDKFKADSETFRKRQSYTRNFEEKVAAWDTEGQRLKDAFQSAYEDLDATTRNRGQITNLEAKIKDIDFTLRGSISTGDFDQIKASYQKLKRELGSRLEAFDQAFPLERYWRGGGYTGSVFSRRHRNPQIADKMEDVYQKAKNLQEYLENTIKAADSATVNDVLPQYKNSITTNSRLDRNAVFSRATLAEYNKWKAGPDGSLNPKMQALEASHKAYNSITMTQQDAQKGWFGNTGRLKKWGALAAMAVSAAWMVTHYETMRRGFTPLSASYKDAITALAKSHKKQLSWAEKIKALERARP